MPQKYKTIERTPEKAMSLIERKFRRVQRSLKKEYKNFEHPFSTEMIPYLNSDDSVTVDFRIMNINTDIDIDSMLLTIHESIDQTAVNGTWLSVGFYNPPSVIVDSEDGYRRTQGMLFYRTHSRRWTKIKSTLIIEQARTSTENFKNNHSGARPLGIVLRAWWNIEGDRPNYKDPTKIEE